MLDMLDPAAGAATYVPLALPPGVPEVVRGVKIYRDVEFRMAPTAPATAGSSSPAGGSGRGGGGAAGSGFSFAKALAGAKQQGTGMSAVPLGREEPEGGADFRVRCGAGCVGRGGEGDRKSVV